MPLSVYLKTFIYDRFRYITELKSVWYFLNEKWDIAKVGGLNINLDLRSTAFSSYPLLTYPLASLYHTL